MLAPLNRLPPFADERKLTLKRGAEFPVHPTFYPKDVVVRGKDKVYEKDTGKLIGTAVVFGKPTEKDMEILRREQRKNPAQYSIGRIRDENADGIGALYLSVSGHHAMIPPVEKLVLIRMNEPPPAAFSKKL